LIEHEEAGNWFFRLVVEFVLFAINLFQIFYLVQLLLVDALLDPFFSGLYVALKVVIDGVDL